MAAASSSSSRPSSASAAIASGYRQSAPSKSASWASSPSTSSSVAWVAPTRTTTNAAKGLFDKIVNSTGNETVSDFSNFIKTASDKIPQPITNLLTTTVWPIGSLVRASTAAYNAAQKSASQGQVNPTLNVVKPVVPKMAGERNKAVINNNPALTQVTSKTTPAFDAKGWRGVAPFSFTDTANTKDVIPSTTVGTKQQKSSVDTWMNGESSTSKTIPWTLRYFMEQGMTKQDALKERNNFNKTNNPVKGLTDQTNPNKWIMDMTESELYGAKAKKAGELTDQMKNNIMKDQNTMLDMLNSNNRDVLGMLDQSEKETNDEMAKYEAEQADLFKDYDSNRMNQVRGQLLQSLASRGIDISKLAPEQLIALSGDVWVKAFSDVAERKAAYKNSVANARNVALAKIQNLRNNKVLNNNQYRQTVQSINSAADQKLLESDQNFANQLFGTREAQLNKQTSDKANTVTALQNAAQAMGLTGTSLQVLGQYLAKNGTWPEVVGQLISDVSNTDSPVYKQLAAIESKNAADKAQKNAIDKYEAETKRIAATKK